MPKVRRAVSMIWQEEGASWGLMPLACLFKSLAFPYRAAVAVRNRLYDRRIIQAKKLPCPVISVGNIAAGGTGKTPTVIMLAKILREMGYRPAVLSRGYGRRAVSELTIVSDGQNIIAGPHEGGDEPYMAARRLPGTPVVAGKNRFLAGRLALDRLGADIIILDDGFQHRRLHRDLDIVLINEDGLIRKRGLLPGGCLREPLQSLGRADVIFLSDLDLKPNLPAKAAVFYLHRRPLAVVSGKGETLHLDWLRDKRVYAFAGIARPESFLRTLEDSGASLTGFLAFEDHHVFEGRDIAEIKRRADGGQSEAIVTTEKDMVRLLNFPDFFRAIHFLLIEAAIMARFDEFSRLMMNRLKRFPKQGGAQGAGKQDTGEEENG